MGSQAGRVRGGFACDGCTVAALFCGVRKTLRGEYPFDSPNAKNNIPTAGRQTRTGSPGDLQITEKKDRGRVIARSAAKLVGEETWPMYFPVS